MQLAKVPQLSALCRDQLKRAMVRWQPGWSADLQERGAQPSAMPRPGCSAVFRHVAGWTPWHLLRKRRVTSCPNWAASTERLPCQVQRADDVRLERPLLHACSRDMRRFCKDVEMGERGMQGGGEQDARGDSPCKRGFKGHGWRVEVGEGDLVLEMGRRMQRVPFCSTQCCGLGRQERTWSVCLLNRNSWQPPNSAVDNPPPLPAAPAHPRRGPHGGVPAGPPPGGRLLRPLPRGAGGAHGAPSSGLRAELRPAVGWCASLHAIQQPASLLLSR